MKMKREAVYILLVWAMVLTTIVVLRVTDVAVITALGATGSTAVITSVLGIIGGVISFYTYKRGKDTHKSQKCDTEQ